MCLLPLLVPVPIPIPVPVPVPSACFCVQAKPTYTCHQLLTGGLVPSNEQYNTLLLLLFQATVMPNPDGKVAKLST